MLTEHGITCNACDRLYHHCPTRMSGPCPHGESGIEFDYQRHLATSCRKPPAEECPFDHGSTACKGTPEKPCDRPPFYCSVACKGKPVVHKNAACAQLDRSTYYGGVGKGLVDDLANTEQQLAAGDMHTVPPPQFPPEYLDAFTAPHYGTVRVVEAPPILSEKLVEETFWRAREKFSEDRIVSLVEKVSARNALIARAAPILADAFPTHPEVAKLIEEIKAAVG